eukprot:gene563-1084_t
MGSGQSNQSEAEEVAESKRGHTTSLEDLPPTSFPSWYMKNPQITQEDIYYASASFQIIMSGFWTAPFLERKKMPDFRHTSTTTWFYETFYEGLFGRHPEVREMFKHVSMFSQGRLLVGTLSLSLDVLSDEEMITKKLTALSVKHNRLGVKRRFYSSFGESLLEALKECLGPLYDEPTELAWRKLYSWMLSVILPQVIESDDTDETHKEKSTSRDYKSGHK